MEDKFCPICGSGVRTMRKKLSGIQVICPKCRIKGTTYKTRSEALEAWCGDNAESLTLPEARMLRLKYIDRLTWEDISNIMHYCVRYCYALRNQAIIKIAGKGNYGNAQ